MWRRLSPEDARFVADRFWCSPLICHRGHQDCGLISCRLLCQQSTSPPNQLFKAHRALEIAGPRDYFVLWPIPEAPPWCSHEGILVTFVTSTFGSFGVQAQALIKDIGRRTNLFVPPSLSHETSWATSSITTFLRSALTFQVRKRVAVILRLDSPWSLDGKNIF